MTDRRKISFPSEEYLIKLLQSVVTQTLSQSYPDAVKEIRDLKQDFKEHLEADKRHQFEEKELLNQILTQAKETNGRVTKLETWQTATLNYAKGVKQGGKWMYGVIAIIFGVLWVIFGEFIKVKLGLK